MRNAVLSSIVLCVAISGSPVQAQTRIPYEKAPYNDTVIQCGALFALLADGYEGAGEKGKSIDYQRKFAKQLKASEDEFESVGRPKLEAAQIYQERRGILATTMQKNTKMMAGLVRFCDQKYPL
ncbi:hypothetical protein G6L29_00065 [Agrobacterium rhizogenes]|jgi:hypothetical protein|uniref:hypothetical protein n=1 Tax=Rhizobium rhizogenes TaxID=359 RepID=UPI0004D479C8|nr:hypothetical protein [Rhizobium rhizogenes]KEA08025.1 hypothetical protein CN09_34535 [Rhizobium rhizogenes]MQB34660.1 hypothetical protein [Rhizobium rhizogenes]NTF66287.1 hypothetical protein [Rhizobium rhizogenes]NTG05536.1 hypothetical protein [Rhizobium rhizogenes]NTI14022.1 hypothetical protein [Rhizobium rhizogenes]